MTEFKRILQSKVDINLKIAKLLTNAMNWKLDFTAFKGSKYTLTMPVIRDTLISHERYEDRKQTAQNNLLTVKAMGDDIDEMSRQHLDRSSIVGAQSMLSNRSNGGGATPMFLKSTCCG